MGRGQSETIESNLLLGAELHEALRPRSDQRSGSGIRSMRDFDLIAPRAVVELKDWLLDQLPDDYVSDWTDRVLQAACANADYGGMADRLAVRRLEEECLPLAAHWPEGVRDRLSSAIQASIDALENDADRDEAKSITWKIANALIVQEELSTGAWAAIWAAESASYSLAAQHKSALRTAKQANEAVWENPAAADTAVCREAERFVEELEKLPAPFA